MRDIQMYVILKNSWYDYDPENSLVSVVKICYSIHEAHKIVSGLNSEGNIDPLDKHSRSTYYFNAIEESLPSWVGELISMNDSLLEVVEKYEKMFKLDEWDAV